MRRAWVLLVVACGSAAPAPSAPSNRVTIERPEPMSTTLKIYVQDVRRHCGAKGAREHIEVTVDDRSAGTITVFCIPSTKVSSQARQFRLAHDPVVLEGRHRIGVRHLETGRATAKEFAFPAGRPADPHEAWIERDKLRVTLDHVTLAIGELGVF